MKYAFIRAHQTEFHVRAMCRVLRVHFSGFYAWLKEPLSHRAREDARQTGLIRQAWSESGKVYGYRKHGNPQRSLQQSLWPTPQSYHSRIQSYMICRWKPLPNLRS